MFTTNYLASIHCVINIYMNVSSQLDTNPRDSQSTLVTPGHGQQSRFFSSGTFTEHCPFTEISFLLSFWSIMLYKQAN